MWQGKEGETKAYMASPTRQVRRAAEGEFEVEYQKALPLEQSQMHSIDYRTVPFHQPLDEGSGRTIAESVFFNTEVSLEEIFKFYRDYFSNLGWEAGDRDDEFIGDNLHSASLVFTKRDASVLVTARPWGEDSNRVNIEGNGLWFPGTRFCQMMARPDEAVDIE